MPPLQSARSSSRSLPCWPDCAGTQAKAAQLWKSPSIEKGGVDGAHASNDEAAVTRPPGFEAFVQGRMLLTLAMGPVF